MPSSLTNVYAPLRVMLVAGDTTQSAKLASALAHLRPEGILVTCSRFDQAIKEFQNSPCDVVLVASEDKPGITLINEFFSIARQRGVFVYAGQVTANGSRVTWHACTDCPESLVEITPDSNDMLALKLRSIQVFRQLWLGYTETARLQDAMLDNVRDGVIILDEDDRLVQVNRTASRMLGLGQYGLQGRTLSSVMEDSGKSTQLLSAVPPMHVPGRPDWRMVMLKPALVLAQHSEAPPLLQDVLTGLPTHILMQDRLNKAVHLSSRFSRTIGVLCLDVDGKRLAEINDTHGYAGGDYILHELANRLNGAVRLIDTIARSESSRFVAILQELSHSEDALLVAKRMAELCREPIRLSDGVSVELPVYIGVACFPEHGKTAADLLARAESALTMASVMGDTGTGTPICVYQADFSRHNDRALFEQQLLAVLDNHEMLMFYQPKLNVATNQLVGVEALIRWNCEGSVRGPGNLIAIAEELGLIGRITHQALRDSARQAAVWYTDGKEIPVAVNIPPGEFNDELFHLVKEVLAEFSLPPRLLELEVTESAMHHRNLESTRVMQDLLELGVHLSLDDFGTGHSSLDRIRTLPLTALKIDRCFIHSVQDARVQNGEVCCSVESVKDLAILRSIVAIGHNLNLKVIAEGVEELNQLEVLRVLEVDTWQGFYASPAMAPADFDRWHARWVAGVSG